jgi:hypothetical protein
MAPSGAVPFEIPADLLSSGAIRIAGSSHEYFQRTTILKSRDSGVDDVVSLLDLAVDFLLLSGRKALFFLMTLQFLKLLSCRSLHLRPE